MVLSYAYRRSFMVWCTDGYKISKGAGADVFRWDSRRREHSFVLGLDVAVFHPEIYAIKVCVMGNTERGYTGKSICVLSDSQATIKALNIFQMKSKLVWDCHHLLMRLAECNRTQLMWVLGHKGNGQKQQSCNQLARQGSSHPPTGPEPALGISSKVVIGPV